MEIVVLDTDVWSYLYKGDTRADLFRDFLLNKQVAISFQTVAELYFWAKIEIGQNLVYRTLQKHFPIL